MGPQSPVMGFQLTCVLFVSLTEVGVLETSGGKEKEESRLV